MFNQQERDKRELGWRRSLEIAMCSPLLVPGVARTFRQSDEISTQTHLGLFEPREEEENNRVSSLTEMETRMHYLRHEQQRLSAGRQVRAPG